MDNMEEFPSFKNSTNNNCAEPEIKDRNTIAQKKEVKLGKCD
jgi:hypothetical protein